MTTTIDDLKPPSGESGENKTTANANDVVDENEALENFASELPKQYELLNKISEGGMGAIYKIQNRHTRAFSAIKILRAKAASDSTARRRFIVEAKSASLLKHPNICRVNDFGVTDSDTPYLIMDWIDGISLAQKIQRDSVITPGESILIFKQLAAALAHAHHHKIVHRDLKPENIMLTRTAAGATIAHLVDFGVAKLLDDFESTPLELTQTGVVVGTPLYMSPEQATGGLVDCRTDIYCFGCVMYFALTGKPPFFGPNLIATINQHIAAPPPEFASSLKIPHDLQMLVYRCLEKKAADRYQNIEALLGDLGKLASGRNINVVKSSHTKQKEKNRLVTSGFFVFGFIVMYLLSILLQSFFDFAEKKETKESMTTDTHSKMFRPREKRGRLTSK